MHLNEKKRASALSDSCKAKMMKEEFRSRAKTAKIEYKNKVEKKFEDGDAREAWQGLNTMMGRMQKQQRPDASPAGVPS